MSGTILKWGIPAFLTVIGGTLAAVATSGAAIPIDLETRTRAALAEPAHAWAHVSFDAQDATLSGTAATPQAIDAATARIAAVHGVRTVVSQAVVAEAASPYPFVATVSAGHLTLSGGLPDEAARAEILAIAGQGATDNLRLMSGAPDRATWLAAARYAVDQATRLDEGEVALADLALTLSGRARSSEAYDQLLEPADTPQGLARGFSEVQPPLASPFEWHAEFDGARLNLSGVAPSEALVAELAALAPTEIPVATSLTLASGAPDGFDANARLLLQNLLKLESGSAAISGETLTLDGIPADPAVAESVRVAMTPAGAKVTLGAPHVAEYWLSAERTETGITLDGFVPDAAMRDRLEVPGKVDASGLELARGAPERFESAVDFVLEALSHVSTGHANIQGTVITLEGRATTLADYTAVQTALQLGAPQGLVLGAATVKPPIATPFTFAAEKAADGSYALSGYVPSEDAHTALRNALPELATDALTLADGNPEGFESQAIKALQVLALLDTGRIAYDGSAWSVTGDVDTAPKAEAAEQAFDAAGLRSAGWAYTVAAPAEPETAEVEPLPAEVAETAPQPETPALPVSHTYVFEAKKAIGAPVTLEGIVPAESTRAYLARIADAEPGEALAIGTGLPPDFDGNAEAGTRALKFLADGEFGLTGDSWIFTGRAETDADRKAALVALAIAPTRDRWQTDITVLPPLLVCEQKLGAFQERNAILFDSGSARIADTSAPAIDELAGYLALCPEATVNVEGHTDSDGAADANLALSVSRAEAVVNALITRGISPERLYAVGYGESLPVASNETRAGKQANRRIAFSLADE